MQESIWQALTNLDVLESFQEITDISFRKELTAYKKFYMTFLLEYEKAKVKDAKMLLNHMRSCGIHKLFDEPEQYDSMDIKILLDGILGKHLRDLVSLLHLYEIADPPLKEQLFLELHRAFLILPNNSPCLDAYSTELDRLVRVYTEPLEDKTPIQGATLTAQSFEQDGGLDTVRIQITDFAKAQSALESFLNTLSKNGHEKKEATTPNFAVYLRSKQFYNNSKYGTYAIRNFQTVCNLLQDIHMVKSVEELFENSQ